MLSNHWTKIAIVATASFPTVGATLNPIQAACVDGNFYSAHMKKSTIAVSGEEHTQKDPSSTTGSVIIITSQTRRPKECAN